MILAIKVWIDRVSPTLNFAEREAEPELEIFEMDQSYFPPRSYHFSLQL